MLRPRSFIILNTCREAGSFSPCCCCTCCTWGELAFWVRTSRATLRSAAKWRARATGSRRAWTANRGSKNLRSLTGSRRLGHLAGLPDEWAARLPEALISAAFLVFFYLTLAREFSPRMALAATAILATSAGWMAYSFAALTDLPMSAALGAAMLIMLFDPRRAVLAGALLGLSILGKGFVPVVLIAPLLSGRARETDGDAGVGGDRCRALVHPVLAAQRQRLLGRFLLEAARGSLPDAQPGARPAFLVLHPGIAGRVVSVDSTWLRCSRSADCIPTVVCSCSRRGYSTD